MTKRLRFSLHVIAGGPSATRRFPISPEVTGSCSFCFTLYNFIPIAGAIYRQIIYMPLWLTCAKPLVRDRRNMLLFWQ